MTGQPDGTTDPEELSDEGVGLGMSEDETTFEPEEDPETVDEPDRGTLTYEQEASASLVEMGEEEPSTIDYGDRDEVAPDELREVPVDLGALHDDEPDEDLDDDPAHRL